MSNIANNNSIAIESVTEYTEELAEGLRSLAAVLGQNYHLLEDRDINEMLNSSNTFLIVARDTEKSRIAGMVTLLVFRTPYHKKSSIEDLVVDEAYRGRHIGRMLVEKAISLAKEKGAVHIDLTSRPQRESSNNLYKAMGFEKRETNVYRKVIDYGEVK